MSGLHALQSLSPKLAAMKPELNLLAVLNLLGAAQGLLLALALWTVGRGNRTANRILAALTLTISIFVCGAVLRTTGYLFVYPHLSWVHDPFPFLAGPLLYLYMRSLTSGREGFARGTICTSSRSPLARSTSRPPTSRAPRRNS